MNKAASRSRFPRGGSSIYSWFGLSIYSCLFFKLLTFGKDVKTRGALNFWLACIVLAHGLRCTLCMHWWKPRMFLYIFLALKQCLPFLFISLNPKPKSCSHPCPWILRDEVNCGMCLIDTRSERFAFCFFSHGMQAYFQGSFL